jgi:SAM-dependent methyltransferase
MQLYGELAEWWPLVSPPSDYAEEAEDIARCFKEAATSPIVDLLELGSGGGNNASYLKDHFAVTLVEPAAGMRAHSLALNPACTHVAGDMRTVRLGRTFDAVLVHDAIAYMTTEADLLAAMATIAVHLKPGGVALIIPDVTAETFQPGADLEGHDESPDGERADHRSVRYMMWTMPPRPWRDLDGRALLAAFAEPGRQRAFGP